MKEYSEQINGKTETENLQFERLLATLSAQFINVQAQDIDKEIGKSLEQVCNLLNLDISALWEFDKYKQEEIILTNYFRKYEGPPIPEILIARDVFPYSLNIILKKESLKFTNPDELPFEANIDAGTYMYYGIISSVTFPLYTGTEEVFGIISFNSVKEEIVWTEEIINRLQFVVQVFSNALSRKYTDKILQERLEYEKLFSRISAQLIYIPAKNVDDVINDSLKQISDYFGTDVATLWQVSLDKPEYIFLTHYYRKYGGPPVPDKFIGNDYFPWTLEQLLQKKIVKYPNAEALPPEAAVDAATRRHFGLISAINFPLFVGNDKVFGTISFNTVNEERTWTEDTVNRIQSLSQLFANALFRKRTETLLYQNENRIKLASAFANAGFWDLIISTGEIIWSTEEARILYNVQDIEKINFDFIKKERIHPDDLESVNRTFNEAPVKGSFYSEYRVVHSKEKVIWLAVRGIVHYNSKKEAERLIGLSVDISHSKETEKSLRSSEELKSSVINSLVGHLAVIDKKGTIITVNDAWTKFAIENSTGNLNAGVGVNYLTVIENSLNTDSNNIAKHLKGIKSVLNGKSLKYEAEYSCDSPTEERWFIMSVTPLAGEEKGAVIVHRNITELKKTQRSLENALTDIKKLKEELQKDNVYLKEEIKIQTNFGNILGHSDAIKYCLFNVEKVAPLNTTVLIYGETGTGKELITRAIHNASSRSDRPLIKVDCSSLPPNIIESELFGREKGAYTDAKTKSVGRFELANGSTLFLDEISELPMEVQGKLLRVTQYGEYERLGSSKTHKVDVRIIAATNRDLEEEVKNGRFREDLFFRLNVFRITVPPLRERKEDIPEMVLEFVKNINRKLGKNIEFISQATLKQLMDYSWPGNVRELENKIEYSVITSSGNELEVQILPQNAPVRRNEIIPLSEVEREYIIQILEMSNWKIEGKNSASEILKLAPSTLRDRMKKLKIKRNVQ